MMLKLRTSSFCKKHLSCKLKNLCTLLSQFGILLMLLVVRMVNPKLGLLVTLVVNVKLNDLGQLSFLSQLSESQCLLLHNCYNHESEPQ